MASLVQRSRPVIQPRGSSKGSIQKGPRAIQPQRLGPDFVPGKAFTKQLKKS